MRTRATLLLLLVLPFLPSCAAIHRPPATLQTLSADAVVAGRTERAVRDTVLARLVRRVVARGDGSLDVLMLSGGGQNGAFGTGFLRGWRSRTDEAMPQFDLITGISTGALQAPYALLGTTVAMDTLTELYRNAQERVAPSIDWWSWLRKTGGLVNTKKFDHTLRQSVNGEFGAQLRQALGTDRQVVFATTDYDLGIGRTWLLADALGVGDAGLARTQLLLKAATSIPGIFPPVIVDGHVHGDGGVITNVLPLLELSDYEQLGKALRARGVPHVTIRLYVVMNMWAHAPLLVMDPANRKAISSRSNEMLFYAHQPQTLELLETLSHAITTSVSGITMQFKLAALPSDQSLVPGAQKLFDRAFIQHLDSLGYAKAISAGPWDVVPSVYDRKR